MLHPKINDCYDEITRYINMFVDERINEKQLEKIFKYRLEILWMKIILNIKMDYLKNMNMKVIRMMMNQNK